MRHCTRVLSMFAGDTGANPLRRIIGGASAPELAIRLTSTSCGGFSASWLSLPYRSYS